MFKKAMVMFSVFLLLISFSSCKTNSLVTNETIRKDIEEHEKIQSCFSSNFVTIDKYTVSDFSITKRQTNSEEKEDLIFSAVTLNNNYFEINLSIETIYNYYDYGGWILDELNILEKQVIPINSPDSKLVAEYYNNKLKDESNSGILFIDDSKKKYSIDEEVEPGTSTFNGDKSTVNVLCSKKMCKLYGNIELNFSAERGWEIGSIYEFTDNAEEYIKIVSIESDYTQALGKYSCKSGVYAGATLDIIKIDESSIEYELIIPDSEFEFINSPGHRTADFNPIVGELITEYTYSDIDLPFSYFNYNADNDSWDNAAQIDFDFTR